MAVHVADERFLAVVDHLHGAVRVQCEQRAVDLHREVLTAAERPTHAGEVDPDSLRSEVEARGDLVPVDVEPLRGDVDVHAALAVGHRQAGLRAQERLILLSELVVARDGDVAPRLGVAVADDDVAHDVRTRVVEVTVAVRPRLVVNRGLLGRPLDVDHRIERLVDDADPLRRAPRLLGILGGDDGDRLTEVAHSVEGEHRLIGELEPVALLPRDVLVRQHCVHAGERQRFGEIELDDPRVRVRAPQRVPPEHPGGVEVAGVGELAGRLRDCVGPLDALADAADCDLTGRRAHEPAASLTASKIFA